MLETERRTRREEARRLLGRGTLERLADCSTPTTTTLGIAYRPRCGALRQSSSIETTLDLGPRGQPHSQRKSSRF